MPSSRVGSLSLVNEVLRDVSNTQVRLGELQTQISSGYQSPNFAGINGSVEKFTQVTSQLNRSKQFNSNNMLNITKLQTADVAIQKMIDIADNIKNNIIAANGAVIETSNLPQVVADMLVSFGSQLNTSFNGYYLFGGSDTTTVPVPDTTVGNTYLGIPDTNYYRGSAQDTVMRADDLTQITFPVRADDPAFQKIYAAAKMAIEAAERGDTIAMSAAQQLIQEGQGELVEVQSRLGAALKNIESVDERLKSLTTYWQGLSDSISKTDIVAASTKVANDQAILQASFQVYSRLSQLRLSDYL